MLLLAQITPLADLSRVAYYWIFFKIHFIITLHSSIAATSESQYKKRTKIIQNVINFCPCLAISCPAFSCPAFSCPAIWSVNFMSYNFMPCNFDGPSFSCPSFSAPPVWLKPSPVVTVPNPGGMARPS